MNKLQYLLLMAAFFGLTALISYFVYKKKGKSALILFYALTGALLRINYCFYTPHWERQHDVVGFGNEFGQAAYIEWFYNNFKLPDFDPRDKWGFFQPPLHHMTAALFMRVQTLFGIGYTKACENVMLLTCAYSLLMLYFSYRIFKQMKLSGWPLYIAFALSAIHPGFILLSGSINNDCLCELFMVMGLFYAVEWYRKSTVINIIKIAFCVGLAMFTKLLGAIIAPGIALLFLLKWISGGKKDFLKYLKQFAVFALISFPLGLFYPVRNFVRFNVPLNFTPEVGEPVGSYSFTQRLFDIKTATPFACMIKNGDTYDEYNIFLAMLKTSLFGETNLSADSVKMVPFAWAALVTAALLAVFALLATIYVCIVAIKEKNTEYLFWGTAYIVPVVFMINLCFSAPYFSSQDFRYIQYVIIVEALFTGLFFKQRGNIKSLKKTGRIYFGVLCIFTASVTAVYVLLGAASVEQFSMYLGIY